MPRKPPKLTRAQRAAAIEYAVCEADWWSRPVDTIPHDKQGYLETVPVRGRRTRELVEDLSADIEILTTYDAPINALEAAALLRDGWNPGDPVERR